MVQQIANLLMLRGNFGRPGAGISPIRGHSNVQGDRTVGIDEKPTPAYLDRVRDVFGFEPPREHGHHTVESVEAMKSGQAKVFIGLGGNFVRAVPDTEQAYAASQPLNLAARAPKKPVLPLPTEEELAEDAGVSPAASVMAAVTV